MPCRKLVNFTLFFLIVNLASPSVSESSPATKIVSDHKHSAIKSATKIISENKDQVTIILDSIEAKKLSQKSGDKIYIGITQYSSLGLAITTRVPEKPTYWVSKQLSEVKDLVLWSGVIKKNEEIKLIFSVVEEDFSSWDVDDLIGNAQIVLFNKNGKIERRWELPVFEENTEMMMLNAGLKTKNIPKGNLLKEKSPLFRMKGRHSHYVLSFSFEETPEAVTKK